MSRALISFAVFNIFLVISNANREIEGIICSFGTHHVEQYVGVNLPAYLYGCKAIEFLGSVKEEDQFHDLQSSRTANETDKEIKFFGISKRTFQLPENLGFVLKDLEVYEAKNKRIKFLKSSNFLNLNLLRALTLSGNDIEELPENIFDNLEVLEVINLKENKISFISSDIFNHLATLKVVNFVQNLCVDEEILNEFNIRVNELNNEKCNVKNSIDGKIEIIGQQDKLTANLEIPFGAQVYRSFEFICSGSVVTDRFILTSANCFDIRERLEEYFVLLGNSALYNGLSFDLEKIIIHYAYTKVMNEDYSDFLYTKNDLALLKTLSKIPFTINLQPVILNEGWSYVRNGTAIIVGWGWSHPRRNETNTLQAAVVRIEDNCANILPEQQTQVVDQRQVCTTTFNDDARSTEFADTGGMVLTLSNKNLIQIGVISSGPTIFPDVHERISSHINWIQSTMQREIPNDNFSHKSVVKEKFVGKLSRVFSEDLEENSDEIDQKIQIYELL
ncbi:CLUMA_CG012189, isoform A [Clunio marinus]|uniref:CLUMA_CG012189, isoform A n=1 Tax=Clunio marinus TaxID=568069 RepID=A0A1J1IFY5_9DIPT|nr:CLUMA_CG012189, isoform A [Clunio marinus]